MNGWQRSLVLTTQVPQIEDTGVAVDDVVDGGGGSGTACAAETLNVEVAV